jgi:hypothetical protein
VYDEKKTTLPYFTKVSLVSPLARNGCQSWTFLGQIIKAPYCCPPFLAGNSSLCVNTQSSRGNVYFANRQTDRILVPYKQPGNINGINFRKRVVRNCFPATK